MQAPHLIPDADDELARVVARIQARGAHRPLTAPSAESIAAVIAHLRDEEPLSDVELAERERQWRLIEDEARARDEANDRAEGHS